MPVDEYASRANSETLGSLPREGDPWFSSTHLGQYGTSGSGTSFARTTRRMGTPPIRSHAKPFAAPLRAQEEFFSPEPTLFKQEVPRSGARSFQLLGTIP